MLRILANDGMEASAVEALKAKGFTVDTKHHSDLELKEILQNQDCLVVRSATKVRKEIIDAAAGGKLKLVIRAGVGVDNIDVEYAMENGIEVHNTPNASSASVAELALGHMFTLARHLHHSNVTMKKGEWNKKEYQGTEIHGKTLGLIGFGRIAKVLAKKALALGMKVVYTDMHGPFADFPEFEDVGMETLLAESDFISLHIPYLPEIGAVIGEKELKQMKKTAYLINAARGGVVDEAALVAALDAGEIAGAALDVFEEEPTKNQAVLNHPKISLTPHIGAATDEAQERIGAEVVHTILHYFNR